MRKRTGVCIDFVSNGLAQAASGQHRHAPQLISRLDPGARLCETQAIPACGASQRGGASVLTQKRVPPVAGLFALNGTRLPLMVTCAKGRQRRYPAAPRSAI
jgi:hypothetical protein